MQHISGVDNIVADTLIIFPSKLVDKYDPGTSTDQCRANDLLTIDREENNYYCFTLGNLNVQREKHKEDKRKLQT